MLDSDTQNCFNMIVDAPCSYSAYIENAVKVFDKHYARIGAYINHVKSQITSDMYVNFKICFLMEDVSIIGPTVFLNGHMENVQITLCKEFLDHLANRTMVDWILSIPANNQINSHTKKKLVYFYSKKYIDEYQRNARPYAHMKFISWLPHIVGGKIQIK